MRDKLIKKITLLSKQIDNDDLEYINWNLFSNDDLLDMFKRLIAIQVIMERSNNDEN